MLPLAKNNSCQNGGCYEFIDEKEEKGKKFHRIERSYGSFERSFTLPDDTDKTKVTSDFKDGILSIHIPKTPSAKPKEIEVKVT